MRIFKYFLCILFISTASSSLVRANGQPTWLLRAQETDVIGRGKLLELNTFGTIGIPRSENPNRWIPSVAEKIVSRPNGYVEVVPTQAFRTERNQFNQSIYLELRRRLITQYPKLKEIPETDWYRIFYIVELPSTFFVDNPFVRGGFRLIPRRTLPNLKVFDLVSHSRVFNTEPGDGLKTLINPPQKSVELNVVSEPLISDGQGLWAFVNASNAYQVVSWQNELSETRMSAFHGPAFDLTQEELDHEIGLALNHNFDCAGEFSFLE